MSETQQPMLAEETPEQTETMALVSATESAVTMAEKEEKNPYKRALLSAKSQIASVIPRHLTPERMIQIAVMAVYRNPKLGECDPMTVVSSTIQAAELGLEPSGLMGHGDLLPVWNGKARKYECQFRPRYGGMVQLARNTGELKNIFAEVVYDDEPFRYWVEDGEQKLTHEPDLARSRQDPNIKGVYAIAKLQSGEVCMTWIGVDDVELIRGKSETEKAKAAGKFQGTTTWEEWYGEMAKKTAVKRLAKLLPKSALLQKAIDLDNREYQMDLEPAPPQLQAPRRKGA